MLPCSTGDRLAHSRTYSGTRAVLNMACLLLHRSWTCTQVDRVRDQGRAGCGILAAAAAGLLHPTGDTPEDQGLSSVRIP